MAKRQLKTLEDIKRALSKGFGQGEGSNYLPWLRVQDVSSKGLSTKITGLKTNRNHHFLSKIEREFFFLAEFSNSVIDIREQFPLFPMDVARRIADILGVKYPCDSKSKDPFVLTTDFLLTRQGANGICYEAISVKDSSAFENERTCEKLEIEFAWWNLLEVPCYVFVGNEKTRIQSKNIQWATSSIRDRSLYSDQELEQALIIIDVGKYLIKDLCNMFIADTGVEHDRALGILQTLIAKKLIEVDMSVLITESEIIDITGVVELEKIREVSNGDS